ncbi:MAG TPA: DUF1223 domain-containing protein [Myxococcales bacterium]|nr:DUF1223 domain-containing protein [Myxococcales bacterium]
MLTLAAATVLVELFTSEGCSSCPPADAVLARLSAEQPVSGVRLVMLAEHVDYWDDLGWRDPFSDHLFTERQSKYGDRMYTPQAVVDGRFDVLGSDGAGIRKAAASAASEPHGGVTCSLSERKKIIFSVSGLPPHGPAQVLLATVEDGLSSKVTRGENAGRTLPHTAVVRSLKGIATLAASENAWSGEFDAPAPHARLVLFVQDRESLRVLAAGSQ